MIGRRHARFHAAAVCLREQGILLPGPRRCGKSVLTLGLLLKGGRYLSEDVAVLEHRSLQLTPCGSGVSIRRESMTVYPEVVERLTAIPPAQDPEPYPQVAFTSPDRIGSGVSKPCAVALIVFPAYSPSTSSAVLEPVPAGQAVLRLLEHCISLGTDVDRGLDVVIALAERARAFSLRYHDPREARDLIVERVTGDPQAASSGAPAPMT
jgi:hypothetical protein